VLCVCLCLLVVLQLYVCDPPIPAARIAISFLPCTNRRRPATDARVACRRKQVDIIARPPARPLLPEYAAIKSTTGIVGIVSPRGLDRAGPSCLGARDDGRRSRRSRRRGQLSRASLSMLATMYGTRSSSPYCGLLLSQLDCM
jgi:hypothetical protein